ncbi:hypothetical protein BWK59_02550 [Flavobacterium davisii]|uniref:Uncharacterized protein n=1 Tax=Flavobacterium davisii TaxID=2906077 RepID=A0A246GL57_9FLAO|nr:hypothetical protein [Flavobacterium davisii]OWP85002.1 hypothetical protein BWK59_02550 [Flavobacterium davisii]
MKNKFTTKSEKEPYTIVYFDVMKDLHITYMEYIVLQTMLHFSSRNEYKKGVSKISNYLKLSRNTIYKYLKKLILKEHIARFEPKSNTYYLKYDIRERFENRGNLYVKIYHKHRKELNIAIKKYALLYMIYSLSKNLKNRCATAGQEHYCKYINISESHFDTVKSQLTKANLLEQQTTTLLKLNENLFNWFDNNKSVQE